MRRGPRNGIARVIASLDCGVMFVSDDLNVGVCGSTKACAVTLLVTRICSGLFSSVMAAIRTPLGKPNGR